MRRTALQLFVIVVAMFAVAGCKRHQGAAQGSVQTETMAPVKGDSAPTGTDALTQTVDVEDSRSEAEGGGLTEPQTADTYVAPGKTAAGSTAATPSKKPAKRPAKKH